MAKYNLPREAWVETIFKRYLHLPDDVVTMFVTALPNDIEQPSMESKQPAPYTYKLLRELEDKTRKNPELVKLTEELKKSISGDPEPGAERARRRFMEDQFSKKRMDMKRQLSDFDLIVSSYGHNPMKISNNAVAAAAENAKTNGTSNGATALQEDAPREPAYRKFMPERL
jgi:hypothetical protein